MSNKRVSSGTVFKGALICAACLWSGAYAGAVAGPDGNLSLVPAQRVLQNARRHITSEPLSFSGEVRSRSGSGRTLEHVNIEITLDFSGTPAIAEYVLSDRMGGHLETLRIERDAALITRLEYTHGPDMEEGVVSDLHGRIRETSLTWNDLTLSFLWWTKAETVGLDTVRGRRCYVIDMYPPDSTGEEESGKEPEVIRVFVDTEMYGLLAAEVYDKAGVKKRELSVRSFRKIDDMWVVKDLSFRSFPSGDRTVVRINDLERAPDE